MSLDDDARAELARLDAANRRREPRVVHRLTGSRIVLAGRTVLDLSSNDYLGLSTDPRIARAAAGAAEEYGVGAGASRLVVGTHRLHAELEGAVADWMGTGAARVFNSGYAANSGVIPALVGAGDVVFSDELNHASIVDGCRLSRARVVVYPHRDLAALERGLVEAAGGGRCLVVSESLFSMDGDLADVRGLSGLCRRHDAALVLDEAHAVGARGPEGRGVAAAEGVVPDLLVGTCGKALGAFGAFVATTPAISELLWNRARPLVFATALPPMMCAAVLAAIEIVRGSEGQARRRTLASHARAVRAAVSRARGDTDSAIVPIVIGGDREAMATSARLLEAGLLVQGIRPPTVPEGTARLRIGLTSALSDSDIATVCDALR